MFEANDDNDTVKDIAFPSPIATYFLRIYPKSWHKWCYLRMEVIGCRPTNECIKDNPCHIHADCNDIVDGYQCTCKSGYTGNGFQCNGMVY